MPRRWYPSRRSGRAVYRTPARTAYQRRHPRAPYGRRGAGSATISATLTLTAAGTKHAAGSVTMTAALTLSAAGTKHAAGAAQLAGTLTLAASGTKHTGVGAPPRPRIRWQFIVGPAAGGHELALTEARGRRFTARLTDNSEVSFSLDGRHPQAAAVDELLTDIHVLWTDDDGNTSILDRCRVGTTGDSGDDRRHTMEVTALDYRAVLARRRLYAGDTLIYTGVDQAEIAWGLISTTQARTGGNLGIAKGWAGSTPTGVPRDREYEARDSIGEKLDELAAVIDGFDWDIVPISASALELQIHYPQRGTDRGVVLEAGGLVKSWRREVNAGDYANAIQYTGGATDADPPVETTPVALEASDLAGRLEGRWDAVYGDDSLILQSTLDERAAWQLDQAQVIQPVYTLTLINGAWRGPGHIWLGDPVRTVIRSGRLDVDSWLRVHEMAFTLGESGEETVEVTVGGPKPDPRRRPSEFDRRLRNLERR